MKKFTDEYAIVANSAMSGLLDDGSRTTNWFSMKNRNKAAFLIQVGVTDTTVDAAVYQSADSTGGSPQALSGFAITQVAADEDNRNYIINVDASDLSSGYEYIACTITAGDGTNGANVACIAVADSRYKATDGDLAAVTEII